MNRYFKQHKRKLFLWMFGEFLCALAMVYLSYFMKSLSDTAYGEEGLSGIGKLLLFGCGLIVFSGISSYSNARFRARFLQACNISLKKDLIHSLLRYDINSFQEDNSATYISLLNNDAKLADEQYFRVVPTILAKLIMLVVALTVMILFDPRLALVCLLLNLFQMLAPMLFGNRASNAQKQYMSSLDEMNAEVKDIFTGYEVIKSFGVEKQIEEKYLKSVSKVENHNFHTRNEQAKAQEISSGIALLAGVLQLVFSVYLIISGDITMGVLMGAMQISNYITNPISAITNLYMQRKTVQSVLTRLLTILDRETEVQTASLTPKTILEEGTPIQASDLSFSYTEERTILNKLNFTFEKGKKYALIGSSGSGKTTLVKLLMGYYRNYQGNILYHGIPLSELDKKSLYEQVAMIHQKVFLFEDTLRNNITMYHSYSDDLIWNAIREAGLSPVVEKMGHGLDSMIEENGKNLSGGEQQRIAIARAFIRGTKVLFLDEATSSLDRQTAQQIETLLLGKKELTLIAVTHKTNPELLEQYDEVLVLGQGTLLEHAPYRELQKNIYL